MSIERPASGPKLVREISRVLAGGTRSAAERRPNVLFIVADDLGDGELGCSGGRIEPRWK